MEGNPTSPFNKVENVLARKNSSAENIAEQIDATDSFNIESKFCEHYHHLHRIENPTYDGNENCWL